MTDFLWKHEKIQVIVVMDATVSVEGKYRILFYEIIVQLLNNLTAHFPKTEEKIFFLSTELWEN